MTKISVALCTYNGGKFLHHQINSILNQTLKVDEIVVCDDGSTDNTHQILKEYQEKFPYIFKIHSNEQNLRSVKNFEKAISLCTGEIIFLSDQDDVWEETKVEIFIQYFNQYPPINAICSNGTFINNDGNPIDQLSIWSIPQLLKDQKIEIDYFNIIAFIENIATGAGMAFRSTIKDNILPIPVREGFHHDEWIALVTSYRKSFMMIDEKLFRYRIHNEQQVGGVSYKNNETTKNRLVNHFNLFSGEKTFSQYKKFLKRLSQSYYKHLALLSEKDNTNIEISKEILKKCKELFNLHRNGMKNKFPVQFLILSTVDIFSKKRKIK